MDSREESQASARRGERVLVANDDAVTRQFLRIQLEMCGYAVTLAADGVEALELLTDSPFGAVLLDLTMPRLDGFEVLERMKEDPVLRSVPVIVVSASDERNDVIRCIELGAADYLMTPVDPLILKARMRASLAAQQLRQTEREYVRYLHQLTQAVAALHEDRFEPSCLDELARRVDEVGQLARLVQELAQEVLLRSRSDSREMLSLHEELRELKQSLSEGSLSGRVLVVDDDDTSRKVLARSLERSGYSVDQAVNGVVALEKLRAGNFDAVLLDLNMPEKDGFQVLNDMKADSQLHDIPVIVISASEETSEVIRLIEMGANDHLAKPFNPHLLQARLRACLVGKRLRDQELAYVRGVTTLTQAAAAIEDESFDPESLSPLALRHDAIGRLARVFQEMARDIVSRQRHLKRQVEQLKTELEQARHSGEQLAESTQTDYSQTLEHQGLEARVVAFCSLRGGLGKSLTVANVGVLLASAGCRVALVDLALGSAGLHSQFGLNASELRPGLNEYLAEKAEMSEVAVDLSARLGLPGRLLLVPAVSGIHQVASLLRSGYDPQLLTRGIHTLVHELEVDIVLIDTQAGLNEELLLALLMAQTAIVMVRPERSHLEGASMMAQIVQRLRGAQMQLLVSDVAGSDNHLSQQLRETYAEEFVGELPQASELAGLGYGEMLSLRHPDHALTSVWRSLASRLALPLRRSASFEGAPT